MRTPPRVTSLHMLMGALLVGTLWSGGYFTLPKFTLATLLLLAGLWELTAVAATGRGAAFGRSPAFWTFLAFAAFSIASLWWSETPGRTEGEVYLMLGYLAALIAARNQAGLSPGAVAALLRWLVYTATFAAAWGIVTYLLRIYPYVSLVDLLLRAGSVFEYSNALGCFGLMALPVTLAFCMTETRQDRPLLAAAASVQFAATALTFSRLGIVLLAAVSLYYLAVSWRRGFLPEISLALLMGALAAVTALVLGEAEYGRTGVAAVALLISVSYVLQIAGGGGRGRRVLKGALSVVAVAGVAAAALMIAVSDRAQLIISKRFGEGLSAAKLLPHRQLTWNSAWDAFRERPVRGWGLGAFYEIYARFQEAQFTKYAHNLLLQTAVDTGIIGAGLLAVFLIYVLLLAGAGLLAPAARAVLRRQRWVDDPVSGALAVAALVFIIYNMFDWEWYVPALTAWFIVVVACLEQKALAKRPPA